MPVLAAVPVKRFFVAKRRLAPVLSAASRSSLGQDLARHTLAAIARTGADVVVLAADDEVAAWARKEGWEAMVDPPGGGLNAVAAETARRASADATPWMIVHADLPLLDAADITAAMDVLEEGGSPLAPSDDGGTSLIGGRGDFSFAYGPASFHRHLGRLARASVLIRRGLILDLDGPADFAAACAMPRGRWLSRYADDR